MIYIVMNHSFPKLYTFLLHNHSLDVPRTQCQIRTKCVLRPTLLRDSGSCYTPNTYVRFAIGNHSWCFFRTEQDFFYPKLCTRIQQTKRVWKTVRCIRHCVRNLLSPPRKHGTDCLLLWSNALLPSKTWYFYNQETCCLNVQSRVGRVKKKKKRITDYILPFSIAINLFKCYRMYVN